MYTSSIDPTPNHYSLDILIRGYPPNDQQVIPGQTPNTSLILRELKKAADERTLMLNFSTHQACMPALLNELLAMSSTDGGVVVESSARLPRT